MLRRPVIPPCGTFNYVVTVPGDRGAQRDSWVVRTCDPVERTGNDLVDSRLVGLSPYLEIVDVGLTPDDSASWSARGMRPRVLRSLIKLSASEQDRAFASSVSFHVDKSFTSAWHPGDLVYISRTSEGGLGISVIRDGILVAAVGAITAVPLGSAIHARLPLDLVRKAEEVFRMRDASFQLPEIPLEVSVGNQLHLLLGGRRRMGDYDLFVVHAKRWCLDGGDECAALSRIGACSYTAANASALLLETDGLAITQW